ncbi:MAG: subtilisin family serine protease [Candidatus Poriferisodalaceae bacterium]
MTNAPHVGFNATTLTALKRAVAFVAAVALFLTAFTGVRALSPLGTANAADTAAPETEQDSEDLGWIVMTDGPGGIEVTVVEDEPGAGTPDGVVAAMASNDVIAVERDARVELLNDPFRPDQWALDTLPFELVHPAFDGTGVVVAVIDTSIAVGHEDLANRFVAGWDAIDDAPYDVARWGVADTDHGTHVTGIVAATHDNATGIAGAAQGVQIMPVRVLRPSGGYVSDVVQGIVWATDNGADVISLSLGTTVRSTSLEAAINAAEANGVVVVAAVGNDGLSGDPVRYPAAFDNAISVGAISSAGTRWVSSSRSRTLDLVAPGTNIVSTGGLGAARYVSMSGTSMATPYVASLVALMLEANPDLTPAQVRSILTTTADDRGPVGWDIEYGHGLIDPAEAVVTALGSIPGPDPFLVTSSGPDFHVVQWDTGPGFWVAGFELVADGVVIASQGVGDGFLPVPTPASAITYSGVVLANNGSRSAPKFLYPAPATFTVVPSDGKATLTWNAVGGAHGYAVLRDGVVIGTTSDLGFVDTDVVNGSQHTYRVAVRQDPGFLGGPSQVVSVFIATTPPAPGPPSSFTAAATATSVDLSWAAPSGNATSIQVERDGSLIATLPANAVGHTDGSPIPGASHVYAVRALGLGGTSPTVTQHVSVPTVPELHMWVLTDAGRVLPLGDASPFATISAAGSIAPVIAGAPTSTGNGIWLARVDGTVDTFGDATHFGDMSGVQLNAPIVGLTVSLTGNGYWMVAQDGGIFTFGDAEFFGSTGNLVLNEPVVDMSVTPSGNGYWLVATDGGVFSFGDARFFGSTGGIRLNEPMVSIAAGEQGYWLVARDGGVFTFGVPFHGSVPQLFSDAAQIPDGLRIRSVDGGAGYYVLTAEGSIFRFGTATFTGSTASLLFPGESAVDLLVLQR